MADFKKQQERLWKTVERFKDEYRKHLNTLSREELQEEILEATVDRYYGAFTTDLVMNVFLEEDILSEKEANALPIEFFRNQIKKLKEERQNKRQKESKKKSQRSKKK